MEEDNKESKWSDSIGTPRFNNNNQGGELNFGSLGGLGSIGNIFNAGGGNGASLPPSNDQSSLPSQGSDIEEDTHSAHTHERVFFIIANVNNKRVSTIVEAGEEDDAVNEVLKTWRRDKVKDVYVVSSLDICYDSRSMMLNDHDVKYDERGVSAMQMIRKNPVNLSCFIDYIAEELEERKLLTPKNVVQLIDIKTKVQKMM